MKHKYILPILILFLLSIKCPVLANESTIIDINDNCYKIWDPINKSDKEAVSLFKSFSQKNFKECGDTFVFLSISNSYEDVFEGFMKKGFNPKKEMDGFSLMELAEQYDSKNIVDILNKYGVKKLSEDEALQLRLIHWASNERNIKELNNLIASGVDLNKPNIKGEYAVFELLTSLPGNVDSEILESVLKNGADPNINTDLFGYNFVPSHKLSLSEYLFPKCKDIPLLNAYLVVSNKLRKISTIEFSKGKHSKTHLDNHKNIIKILLKNGAYVSSKGCSGKTPLHIAAEYNDLIAAKLLLESGAKINNKDEYKKTPLDYAESTEMIKLLKENRKDKVNWFFVSIFLSVVVIFLGFWNRYRNKNV